MKEGGCLTLYFVLSTADMCIHIYTQTTSTYNELQRGRTKFRSTIFVFPRLVFLYLAKAANRRQAYSPGREIYGIFNLNSIMTAAAENEDGPNVKNHAFSSGWFTGDTTIASEQGICWNEGLDGSMAHLGVIYQID